MQPDGIKNKRIGKANRTRYKGRRKGTEQQQGQVKRGGSYQKGYRLTEGQDHLHSQTVLAGRRYE